MAKRVNPHKVLSPEWYEWTHNNVLQVHEYFMAWAKMVCCDPVLEVGCGKHEWYQEQFADKLYTGIDESIDVVLHCAKEHRDIEGHIVTLGNIEKLAMTGCFNLVFSHAVIDHAPDPDEFIRKSIEASRKYTYIMSYRGYFPDISEHKIEKNSRDGYCYNSISIPQVRRLLDELGHKYELREVPTGLPPIEIQSELHIIVEK